jgi:hypothetical protein
MLIVGIAIGLIASLSIRFGRLKARLAMAKRNEQDAEECRLAAIEELADAQHWWHYYAAAFEEQSKFNATLRAELKLSPRATVTPEGGLNIEFGSDGNI